MLKQCAAYAPGNTDLAWTRITPWRALLAAAMDQVDARVTQITVAAEKVSPSADLLSAWLTDRLKAPVTRIKSEGPGITEVVLVTGQGEIRVSRPDGRLATLTVPGQPDRPMALRRREVPALLAEELRRLDPDEVYAATVRRLTKLSDKGGSVKATGTATGTAKGTKGRSGRGTASGQRGDTVQEAASEGEAGAAPDAEEP
jgi:glucose-6-phosphate dehydrogenase assembly protein OpcA